MTDDEIVYGCDVEGHPQNYAHSHPREGLHVECFTCGMDLMEQGWLLFGPPNPSGLSRKYHICRSCVVLPKWHGATDD